MTYLWLAYLWLAYLSLGLNLTTALLHLRALHAQRPADHMARRGLINPNQGHQRPSP
jgi:hypothetical protein